MLLVGSFEPFDEAEARRIGADDILTKPFQSIRRLIDKVSGLVGSKPADEVPTAELPHAQEEAAEPEKLTPEELEITTADTQQLPVAEKHPDYPPFQPVAAVQHSDYRAYEPVVETQLSQNLKPDNFQENQNMDSHELRNESALESGEVLLDLGDIGRVSNVASDDFVLDIDFDESQAPAFEASAAAGTHSFVEPQLSRASDVAREVANAKPTLSTAWMDTTELAYRQHGLDSISAESASSTDQKFVDTQEWKRENPRSTSGDLQSEAKPVKLERVTNEPSEVAPTARPTGPLNLDQLSPEVIDAIARRAVEQLSARVVQEIAWEVVPQLAELLIKRKLEEKQSQPK